MNNRECAMNSDVNDKAAALSESDFQEISEETVMEAYHFEATEMAEDSERDNDFAETLMTPLFVPIKIGYEFKGMSEEKIMGDNFERTEKTETQTTIKTGEDTSEELITNGFLKRQECTFSKETHQDAQIEKRTMSSGLENSSSAHYPLVEEIEIHIDKHFPQSSCSSPSKCVHPQRVVCQKPLVSTSCVSADNSTCEEITAICFSNVCDEKRVDRAIQMQYIDLSDDEELDGVRQRKGFVCSSYARKFAPTHEYADQMVFKCNQCGKVYKHKSNLKRHMCRHIEERPFKCSQCAKAFSRRDELTSHMNVHSEERPLKCKQCKFAFKRNSDLTAHFRIHTGERPYHCNQCGQAFKTSGDLTKHMRTHSKEKPFKCNQCTKAYKRSEELTSHMRTHTGEKPFKCPECGKSFSYRSCRKQHMRIHTPE